MYIMKYDPKDSFDWANDLIRALVAAHRRGVKVKVYLEYRTYFDYIKCNYITYEYLKSQGIEVKLDYGHDTDHMKLVIIDNKIVYIGSHNWSESALYYNHEISVRIVSESLAKKAKEYFYRLWSYG